MSKALLDTVTRFFQPQRPLWACEFTSRHLVAAGVDASRKKPAGMMAAALPSAVLAGSLSEKNILKDPIVFDALKEALGRAGFKGSEISVVIPDDSSRIAFVNAETLPHGHDEREAFVRWKLKKTVPFDVDAAQIAFRILTPPGSPPVRDVKNVDLLVALSPRPVVQEYEALMERLDIHAGCVIPSTLASLNLFRAPKEDVLFVKTAPGCITTTIFQDGLPRFYRRVAEMPLYDAVFPTVMYYQDKLDGDGLRAISVCGYDLDLRRELSELETQLGVPVFELAPDGVEDIFKPALGAANLALN